MNKMTAAAIAGLAALTLAGCSTDADVVSENLSKEADSFNIMRRVVFYNGITDKYIAEVKGRCSTDTQTGVPSGTLAVTCETSPGQYIKDYLGKSDNVTWFMLQIDANAVSPYHYEFVLKPENVIPSFTGSDQ